MAAAGPTVGGPVRAGVGAGLRAPVRSVGRRNAVAIGRAADVRPDRGRPPTHLHRRSNGPRDRTSAGPHVSGGVRCSGDVQRAHRAESLPQRRRLRCLAPRSTRGSSGVEHRRSRVARQPSHTGAAPLSRGNRAARGRASSRARGPSNRRLDHRCAGLSSIICNSYHRCNSAAVATRTWRSAGHVGCLPTRLGALRAQGTCRRTSHQPGLPVPHTGQGSTKSALGGATMVG